MPLTRPLPKIAVPVVDAIRRTVDRPPAARLRWNEVQDALRFDDYYCPMGLHPKATSECPTNLNGFSLNILPPLNYEPNAAIHAFALWWDEQTDRLAALNAVWPRRAGKKGVKRVRS